MLICRLCRLDKPSDAFYRSDHRCCKECIKAATRTNRLKRIEHYRAFDRARGALPHRVAARLEYVRTEGGKMAHNRATSKYAVTQAKRRAAQVAVNNAVRDGRLVRWQVCALPTCDGQDLEAHHADYDQPLDVIWLCSLHHKEIHKSAL